MIRLAGHQAGNGIANGLAQHLQEFHEVLVVAQIRMLDHETAEMPGHTTGNNSLAVVFHRSIGRRDNHPNLCPVPYIVIQVAIGSLVPVAGLR